MGLFVETSGSEDYPPILMIHGIISDHSFFRGMIPLLSASYRTIVYDRRGYGLNPADTTQDYSVKAQAKDAYAVLRSNAKQPAYVLGHSFGGLIALELALEYPEMVRGLILVEPALGYTPEDANRLLEWNRELQSYVNAGKITRAFPSFFKVAGIQNRRRSEQTVPSNMDEIKSARRNLANFMYGELCELHHYLPDKELLERLAVPVIVGISEEQHDNIFAASSKRDAELFGWQVEQFPGNHNSIKDLPRESANKLLDILFSFDYRQECVKNDDH